MKTVGLNNFKKLDAKELSKVQGGTRYYIEVNGTIIVVEIN